MDKDEKLKAAKDLIDFLWKNASMGRQAWYEAGFYLTLYQGEEPTDQYGEEVIPLGSTVKLILGNAEAIRSIGYIGGVMKWDPASNLYTVRFQSGHTHYVPRDWLEVIE